MLTELAAQNIYFPAKGSPAIAAPEFQAMRKPGRRRPTAENHRPRFRVGKEPARAVAAHHDQYRRDDELLERDREVGGRAGEWGGGHALLLNRFRRVRFNMPVR
jgi:hypothetical protein